MVLHFRSMYMSVFFLSYLDFAVFIKDSRCAVIVFFFWFVCF